MKEDPMPQHYLRKYYQMRGKVFTVTFLLFQLVFCSILLYYILKKQQVNLDFLGQIFN